MLMDDYDPACPTEDDPQNIDLSQVPLPPSLPGEILTRSGLTRGKDGETDGRKKNKKKHGSSGGHRADIEQVEMLETKNSDKSFQVVVHQDKSSEDIPSLEPAGEMVDADVREEEPPSLLPEASLKGSASFTPTPSGSGNRLSSRLQFKLASDPGSGKAKVLFQLNKSTKVNPLKLASDEEEEREGAVEEEDKQIVEKTSAGEYVPTRFKVSKKHEMFKPSQVGSNLTIVFNSNAIVGSGSCAVSGQTLPLNSSMEVEPSNEHSKRLSTGKQPESIDQEDSGKKARKDDVQTLRRSDRMAARRESRDEDRKKDEESGSSRYRDDSSSRRLRDRQKEESHKRNESAEMPRRRRSSRLKSDESDDKNKQGDDGSATCSHSIRQDVSSHGHRRTRSFRRSRSLSLERESKHLSYRKSSSKRYHEKNETTGLSKPDMSPKIVVESLKIEGSYKEEGLFEVTDEPDIIKVESTMETTGEVSRSDACEDDGEKKTVQKLVIRRSNETNGFQVTRNDLADTNTESQLSPTKKNSKEKERKDSNTSASDGDAQQGVGDKDNKRASKKHHGQKDRKEEVTKPELQRDSGKRRLRISSSGAEDDKEMDKKKKSDMVKPKYTLFHFEEPPLPPEQVLVDVSAIPGKSKWELEDEEEEDKSSNSVYSLIGQAKVELERLPIINYQVPESAGRRSARIQADTKAKTAPARSRYSSSNDEELDHKGKEKKNHKGREKKAKKKKKRNGGGIIEESKEEREKQEAPREMEAKELRRKSTDKTTELTKKEDSTKAKADLDTAKLVTYLKEYSEKEEFVPKEDVSKPKGEPDKNKIVNYLKEYSKMANDQATSSEDVKAGSEEAISCAEEELSKEVSMSDAVHEKTEDAAVSIDSEQGKVRLDRVDTSLAPQDKGEIDQSNDQDRKESPRTPEPQERIVVSISPERERDWRKRSRSVDQQKEKRERSPSLDEARASNERSVSSEKPRDKKEWTPSPEKSFERRNRSISPKKAKEKRDRSVTPEKARERKSRSESPEKTRKRREKSLTPEKLKERMDRSKSPEKCREKRDRSTSPEKVRERKDRYSSHKKAREKMDRSISIEKVREKKGRSKSPEKTRERKDTSKSPEKVRERRDRSKSLEKARERKDRSKSLEKARERKDRSKSLEKARDRRDRSKSLEKAREIKERSNSPDHSREKKERSKSRERRARSKSFEKFRERKERSRSKERRERSRSVEKYRRSQVSRRSRSPWRMKGRRNRSRSGSLGRLGRDRRNRSRSRSRSNERGSYYSRRNRSPGRNRRDRDRRERSRSVSRDRYSDSRKQGEEKTLLKNKQSPERTSKKGNQSEEKDKRSSDSLSNDDLMDNIDLASIPIPGEIPLPGEEVISDKKVKKETVDLLAVEPMDISDGETSDMADNSYTPCMAGEVVAMVVKHQPPPTEAGDIKDKQIKFSISGASKRLKPVAASALSDVEGDIQTNPKKENVKLEPSTSEQIAKKEAVDLDTGKLVKPDAKILSIEGDEDVDNNSISQTNKTKELNPKPMPAQRLKFKYIPLWEMEESEARPVMESPKKSKNTLSLNLDYGSDSSDSEIDEKSNPGPKKTVDLSEDCKEDAGVEPACEDLDCQTEPLNTKAQVEDKHEASQPRADDTLNSTQAMTKEEDSLEETCEDSASLGLQSKDVKQEAYSPSHPSLEDIEDALDANPSPLLIKLPVRPERVSKNGDQSLPSFGIVPSIPFPVPSIATSLNVPPIKQASFAVPPTAVNRSTADASLVAYPHLPVSALAPGIGQSLMQCATVPALKDTSSMLLPGTHLPVPQPQVPLSQPLAHPVLPAISSAAGMPVTYPILSLQTAALPKPVPPPVLPPESISGGLERMMSVSSSLTPATAAQNFVSGMSMPPFTGVQPLPAPGIVAPVPPPSVHVPLMPTLPIQAGLTIIPQAQQLMPHPTSQAAVQPILSTVLPSMPPDAKQHKESEPQPIKYRINRFHQGPLGHVSPQIIPPPSVSIPTLQPPVLTVPASVGVVATSLPPPTASALGANRSSKDDGHPITSQTSKRPKISSILSQPKIDDPKMLEIMSKGETDVKSLPIPLQISHKESGKADKTTESQPLKPALEKSEESKCSSLQPSEKTDASSEVFEKLNLKIDKPQPESEVNNGSEDKLNKPPVPAENINLDMFSIPLPNDLPGPKVPVPLTPEPEHQAILSPPSQPAEKPTGGHFSPGRLSHHPPPSSSAATTTAPDSSPGISSLGKSQVTSSLLSERKKRFNQSPLAIGMLPKFPLIQSPLAIGPLPKLPPEPIEEFPKKGLAFQESPTRKSTSSQLLATEMKTKVNMQLSSPRATKSHQDREEPKSSATGSKIHIVLKSKSAVQKTLVPGFEDDASDEETAAGETAAQPEPPAEPDSNLLFAFKDLENPIEPPLLSGGFTSEMLKLKEGDTKEQISSKFVTPADIEAFPVQVITSSRNEEDTPASTWPEFTVAKETKAQEVDRRSSKTEVRDKERKRERKEDDKDRDDGRKKSSEDTERKEIKKRREEEGSSRRREDDYEDRGRRKVKKEKDDSYDDRRRGDDRGSDRHRDDNYSRRRSRENEDNDYSRRRSRDDEDSRSRRRYDKEDDRKKRKYDEGGTKYSDRHNDRERSKERERSRERDRGREGDRSREKDRSRERDQSRDRDQSRERSTEREKNRSKSYGKKNRDRSRSRSKSPPRKRERNRSRECIDRNQNRENQSCERDLSRSRSRSPDRARKSQETSKYLAKRKDSRSFKEELASQESQGEVFKVTAVTTSYPAEYPSEHYPLETSYLPPEPPMYPPPPLSGEVPPTYADTNYISPYPPSYEHQQFVAPWHGEPIHDSYSHDMSNQYQPIEPLSHPYPFHQPQPVNYPTQVPPPPFQVSPYHPPPGILPPTQPVPLHLQVHPPNIPPESHMQTPVRMASAPHPPMPPYSQAGPPIHLPPPSTFSQDSPSTHYIPSNLQYAASLKGPIMPPRDSLLQTQRVPTIVSEPVPSFGFPRFPPPAPGKLPEVKPVSRSRFIQQDDQTVSKSSSRWDSVPAAESSVATSRGENLPSRLPKGEASRQLEPSFENSTLAEAEFDAACVPQEMKVKSKKRTSAPAEDVNEPTVSSSSIEDTTGDTGSDSGTDTSSQRPLKVKSRWRRNSEAEAVVDTSTPPQVTPPHTSKLTSPPPESSPVEMRRTRSRAAAEEQSGGSSVETPPPPPPPPRKRVKNDLDFTSVDEKGDDSKPTESIIEEKEEDMETLISRPDFPKFEIILENIHLTERKRSKSMKRMLCDCTTSREDRGMGIEACGADCLNRMLMIECGARCPCGEYCANRRFQKKVYSKTVPFSAGEKGWGLRAAEDMEEKGTFIMEYVGELLDYEEFVRRTRQYSKEGLQHHYFMALNADEVVDATLRGNISRFINHSCDPNCETQKWTVNGELRVGFFTRKPVKKGEELTFDYQFEHYGEPQKCYCGAENCRGYIGLVKSPTRNKKKEKKKKEIFKDELLEEDIEKLSLLDGMRNKNDVLELCRLMVRAEKVQHRMAILKILQDTTETACLRLFLDYHGLPLFWSWMADIGTADYSEDTQELKLLMLSVLKCLPISNKTVLKESKILDIVERWAVAAVAAARKPPPPPPPTAALLLVPPAVDSVETGADVAVGDNEAAAALEAEATALVTAPAPEPEPTASSSETTPPSSPPPSLPLPISTVTPVSILASAKETKEAKQKRRVTFAEVHVETAFSPEPDEEDMEENDNITSSTQYADESSELSADAISVGGNKVGMADSTSQKDIFDLGDMMNSDTDNSDSELVNRDPLASLAAECISQWSSLKEVFKIPKKERVEERKRTERELDVLSKKQPEASDPFAKWKHGRRAFVRKKAVEDEDKKPALPKMSKEERRQLFEAQVKAEDELAAQAAAEEYQRQQEAYVLHQQRLMEDPAYFYSYHLQQGEYANLDPSMIPPEGLVDPVTGQPIPQDNLVDPQTGQHFIGSTGQQIIDPSTGHPVVHIDPNTGQPVLPIDPTTGQPLAHQIDPQTTQAIDPLTGQPVHHIDPHTGQSVHIDPHTGQPVHIDPHTGQPIHHIDPHTGQPIHHIDPHAGQSVHIDPHTGQPVHIDPHTGQPVHIDLNTGQPIHHIDPHTGQPILHIDPHTGQTVHHIDPHTGHPVHIDPHTGQPILPSVDLAACQPVHQIVSLTGQQPTGQHLVHLLDPLAGQRPDQMTGHLIQHAALSYPAQPLTSISQQPSQVQVKPSQAPHHAAALKSSSNLLDFDMEEEVPPPPSPPTVPVTKLPPNWKTAKDSEGRVYYYHAFTRQTQWEMPTWEDDDDSLNDMDLDPLPPEDIIRQSKKKTTTAAADTSSEVARKIKDAFRIKMSDHIILYLNPYRKKDCKVGRISSTDDFKHLARKLTHHVMSKELKHCRHVEDLEVNENVKAKAKDYVRKYMSKFGTSYKKSSSPQPD